MRLDHLLSKEHWPAIARGDSWWLVQSRALAVKFRRLGGARVLVTELEGGTLTSSAGDLVSLLVRLFFGRAWNAVAGGAGRRHAVGS